MGTYLLTWNPAHPEAWESDPIAAVAKKTASETCVLPSSQPNPR